MSNILRSKNGNISKVKYFLSGCRGQNEQPVVIVGAKGTQSRSTNKKKSIVHHNHSQSVASNGDISFQIVGVHQNSHVDSESHNFTQNNSNNTTKDANIHIQKGIQKLKNIKGDKAIEASLSSIRALTNSRQWSLPQGNEKEQFYRFIQTLKDDETYQNTITMFTMMYFYQKKKKGIR